jgi:hypothetical protein
LSARPFCPLLRAGDLVGITADHGNDPTTPSTDHSREYAPLLLFGTEHRRPARPGHPGDVRRLGRDRLRLAERVAEPGVGNVAAFDKGNRLMARRRSLRPRRDPRIVLIAAVIALAGAYFARQNRQPEPPAGNERRTTTTTGRRATPPARGGPAENETPGAPLPSAPGARLASGQAAIGSFNIKWFGSEGPNPRNEENIRDVAQVIQNTGAALLGLGEIGDAAMMDRLVRYLPGYKYVLGTSGRGQKCAMLWDTARASVGRAAEWPDVNAGLTRSEGSLRAPSLRRPASGRLTFFSSSSTARRCSTRNPSVPGASSTAACAPVWTSGSATTATRT